MINTLIVEDELPALELLNSIIEMYCPQLTLVGAAATLEEGRRKIDVLQPDLVFLDIQLGQKTGFDLLDELTHRNFKLIITSAFDQYALKGFNYEAVDYILKPYSPKLVMSAVGRVKNQHKNDEVFRKLTNLIHSDNTKYSSSKLPVSTADGLHLLEMDDIIRLEAQKAYCEILMKNQRKLLVSKPIGEMEKQLPQAKFFRVHSGHLVHMRHVKQVSNQDGGFLIMTDGSQVPLARRRKNDFMTAIQA